LGCLNIYNKLSILVFFVVSIYVMDNDINSFVYLDDREMNDPGKLIKLIMVVWIQIYCSTYNIKISLERKL